MIHLPHCDIRFGALPWLRKRDRYGRDFPIFPMGGGAASPVKSAYGTSNQTITCTLASLASSATAGRASTAIDNSTNVYLDLLIFLKVKTSASALANDKCVYCSAYGTVDGGTTYTDGVSGTDAAYTLTDPSNLRLMGVVNTPSTSTTYSAGPWSMALAFGGALPDHSGIHVRNYTGQNLDATEGNHAKLYQGVYANVG